MCMKHLAYCLARGLRLVAYVILYATSLGSDDTLWGGIGLYRKEDLGREYRRRSGGTCESFLTWEMREGVSVRQWKSWISGSYVLGATWRRAVRKRL